MNHNNHDQIYLAKLYHYLKRKRELFRRRDLTNKFLCKISEFPTIIKLRFLRVRQNLKKNIQLRFDIKHKSGIFVFNFLALSEYINFTNTHKNY